MTVCISSRTKSIVPVGGFSFTIAKISPRKIADFGATTLFGCFFTCFDESFFVEGGRGSGGKVGGSNV